MNSKVTSSLIIVFIYLFAFACTYAIFPLLPELNSLATVLIADIFATLIVFIFSLVFNNSSVYDPYWSVIPPIIVIYLMQVFPDANSGRQLLILFLVCFWSIRLTANWFRGWQGLKHQDWRYTSIAQKTGVWYWPVSFLGIHLMPTLFVFMGCLPFWYTLSSSSPLNLYDAIAAVITLGAIFTEWIADEQLLKFRKNHTRDGFTKSGLWSFSRHPNYFGEINFWLGMFLFVFASMGFNSNLALATSIGFLAMVMLFKFISIPLMERRNVANKPGYTEYIKKVPALFPRLIRSKQST